MVGVNPEVAHETMAGLNFTHAVAPGVGSGQAVPHRPERPESGRYDQDFRFGAANPRAAFFLVKFLEDVGYDGPRHFDAHAYRTEDYEGVKAFARGCMRTYLILKEKAARWNADAEIQAIVKAAHGDNANIGAFSADSARALANREFDRKAIAARGTGVRAARSADDRNHPRRQVGAERTSAALGSGACSRRPSLHAARSRIRAATATRRARGYARTPPPRCRVIPADAVNVAPRCSSAPWRHAARWLARRRGSRGAARSPDVSRQAHQHAAAALRRASRSPRSRACRRVAAGSRRPPSRTAQSAGRPVSSGIAASRPRSPA